MLAVLLALLALAYAQDPAPPEPEPPPVEPTVHPAPEPVSRLEGTTEPMPRDPSSVLEAGLTGRVLVSVEVAAEGAPGRVTVHEPLHPDADAECVRVAKATRWADGPTDAPNDVIPFASRFGAAP